MIRSIAVALTLTVAATAAQASLVTISDSDTDSTAGVNQILTVGDSSTIYVWVTPDAGQTINGLALDVNSSTSPIIEATGVQIFNPQNAVLQNRWNGTADGVLGDLVTGTNAVSVSGTQGISATFAAFDGGTVDATGAFLHMAVTFDATAPGATVVVPGSSAPITDTNGQIFPDFNSGTVQVRDIPEPASLALIALGGLMMIRRR